MDILLVAILALGSILLLGVVTVSAVILTMVVLQLWSANTYLQQAVSQQNDITSRINTFHNNIMGIATELRETLSLQRIALIKIQETKRVADNISKYLLTESLLNTSFGNPPIAGAPMSPFSTAGWKGPGIIQKDGKFVTEDGRHSADTFIELLKKLQDDPMYKTPTEDDLNQMRDQFKDFGVNDSPPIGDPPPENWEDPEADDWHPDDDTPELDDDTGPLGF